MRRSVTKDCECDDLYVRVVLVISRERDSVSVNGT